MRRAQPDMALALRLCTSLTCALVSGSTCADLYFRGTMEEFETAILADLRTALGITNVQGSAGTGCASSTRSHPSPCP